MKMKIAIIDDEKTEREYLHRILEPWAMSCREPVEIKTYSDAKSFLFDWSEEKDFDILLLDIEMPGINGIDTAKTVRRDGATVQIIFITGFYEYFSDGFDVSALHYLIKPVSDEKLYSVLDRAVTNLNRTARAVLLTTHEGDFKIPVSDIVYAEADNVYINVHTEKTVYRVRTTLSLFAAQLDDTFCKVHRSFIVSLRHISSISRSFVTMRTGKVIPISRGTSAKIREALIKYL